MAKEVSTGIRAFVKDSLNQYYKRFQVKLDDNPSKNSQKSAIKIHNDGSIYVYDIGNYTGSVFDNASTLQQVIKAIGQGHGTSVEAGNNIQVDSTETTSIISALGYIYNKDINSFAEGLNSSAFGQYSHIEGLHTMTTNTGIGSHAEGVGTTASGPCAHAEGVYTYSFAPGSHTEGYNTSANNLAEHAEGKYNQSHEGKTIHSIGIGESEQTRKNAFEVMQDGSIYVYGLGNYDGSTLINVSTLQQVIENSGGGGGQVYYAGDNIEITQDNSINALGYTYNSTNKSITIGYNNGGHILTNGNGAFAGGFVTNNSSIESKKDGAFTYGVAYDGGHILTNGNGAFVAGFAQSTNSAISSINASANGSFIFGVASRGGTITANTPGVFINGYADSGTFDVTGEGAHAEGYTIGITKVEGMGAHAEGYTTSTSQKLVKGSGAHAEGYATDEGMDASGAGAHAEGVNTHALNSGAHAEGSYTYANNSAEHAEGKYNQSHKNQTIHSIGIGESEQTRKNAFEVMQDGSIYVYGLGNYDGSTLVNASTLQEVIKAGSGGQTYYAGQNIEITQDNSINALGYTFNGNANVSTFTINSKKSNNHSTQNLFVINSNNNKLLSFEQGVSQDATEEIYTLSIGNYFKIINTTDGQRSTTNIINDNDSGGGILIQTAGANINLNAGSENINLYSETICNNNITAVAFYQSSDERLKNIKSELSVEDCYKLINDCSTIIYSLKTDENNQNQIGMVAQQVKEIMPEVVQESDGYYSINYSRLSVVALNLIKDLSERIIELEKDHNKLEELIKRIEKLEK